MRLTRRELLLATGSTFALAAVPWALAESGRPILKAIPASGEQLPVIGMGTWQTFHVGDDAEARAPLREVLRVFFDQGGTLIDSSPMYAEADATSNPRHAADNMGAGFGRLPDVDMRTRMARHMEAL